MQSWKEQHLFEMEIFCNNLKVFTVTSDQFNVSLLNKVIHFFKKSFTDLNRELRVSIQ